MPGIVGVFAKTPQVDGARTLATMIARMLHEPHYQSGHYVVPEMGVYVGWIAHGGSFAAQRSSVASDPDVVCVCSGTARERTLAMGWRPDTELVI
jgi:asparagine synthase (glutamine-hydrolysing)